MNKEVFVIKDNKGDYLREDSIKFIEKDIIALISNHYFDPCCRAYTTEERALQALENLNKAKIKYGFEGEFHLEQVNRKDLIIEDVKVRDGKIGYSENMVILEKKLA